MNRIIALIALGMGSAALAQAPPPAVPAKKVVVHTRVHTQTHSRTVTHKPSPNGVAHTNVVKKKTVVTPGAVHTKTTTKATATIPAG